MVGLVETFRMARANWSQLTEISISSVPVGQWKRQMM